MMKMTLFDTHCHLDFGKYDADRAAMLKRAREAGVRRMIIPGVDAESMRRARRLALSEADVWIAIGYHPNSTAEWSGAEIRNLREWAKWEKVVSVGEIGLDYHWDKSPKDVQRRAFEDQLALAAELALPVIIHNRDASDDTLPILESWAAGLAHDHPLKDRPGVLHSFSAPMVYAERALAAGFYLGFSGPITYKNADEIRRVAARIPLEKILIETDAPFLTPQPHRGERNEPAYVAYVAERLATLRNCPLETLTTQTMKNGEILFGL